MQYQNEKTIREFVEIARGQIKTLSAICDRIDLELDKPAQPNQPELVGSFVFDDKSPTSRLAPSVKELHDLLSVRKNGINIVTIARELDISPRAVQNRINYLRKAGFTVQTRYMGSRLPKYRLKASA